MSDVRLPTATLADTLRMTAVLLAPMLAEGVILRRPEVTAYAARHDLDRGGVRLLHRMRARYGSRPLRLALPDRDIAVLLNPYDVRQVLGSTPATNRVTARGASPIDRRPRPRPAMERAPDIREPVHRGAGNFDEVIAAETAPLVKALDAGGVVDWAAFARVWWRIARQITLGRRARDDEELAKQLRVLGGRAKGGYPRPRDERRRSRFDQVLHHYLADPDPDSLAGQFPADTGDPAAQLSHGLLAFDATGATVFRTLALLATHPMRAALIRSASDSGEQVRAAVLEAVRLWPTRQVILRDVTTETELGGARLGRGTSLVIASAFFHRDRWLLPCADTFDPSLWLDGRAPAYPGIMPFSAGPDACPGRNLVLLTAGATVSRLSARPLALTGIVGRSPSPHAPLPIGLDHFSLSFARA